MEPLNGQALRSAIPTFALASPVFFQDQGKPAPKPVKGRPLSDFEKEAIKRITKIDAKLGKKLTGKLPQKKTAKDQQAYIRKRMGKLVDERKLRKDLEKKGFATKKMTKAALDRIAKIEGELEDLLRFYFTGKFPKWYVKLLEKRERERREKEDGKSPKTKPAKPTPGMGSGEARVPQNALLIGFAVVDDVRFG